MAELAVTGPEAKRWNIRNEFPLYNSSIRGNHMLRWFYKASIVCFYVTMGLLILANIAVFIFGYEQMKGLENLPLLIRLPVGVLGAFSATGIIALWLGMISDCAFISGLPAWSKAKWLVALALINWLGALLYYYRVFKDGPANFAQNPL
jgi:hypothetical protein